MLAEGERLMMRNLSLFQKWNMIQVDFFTAWPETNRNARLQHMTRSPVVSFGEASFSEASQWLVQ